MHSKKIIRTEKALKAINEEQSQATGAAYTVSAEKVQHTLLVQRKLRRQQLLLLRGPLRWHPPPRAPRRAVQGRPPVLQPPGRGPAARGHRPVLQR